MCYSIGKFQFIELFARLKNVCHSEERSDEESPNQEHQRNLRGFFVA